MGVDFSWGGSASYPRYYDEVEQIAVKCFGAVLNTKFIEDNEKVTKSLLNPSYMFGTIHERDDKFIFPENTPEAIIEFCKKPCDPHDAKPIWEAFQQHPEIEEISDQIWNEAKCCAEYDELYHVE